MVSTIEDLDPEMLFEKYGIAYESTGTDEWKVSCPQHADANPSASFNVEKRVWKCHACVDAKGDLVDLIAGHMNSSRQAVMRQLGLAG